MKILVVDVGGTNAKLLATDQTEVRRFPTGKGMSAGQMVQAAISLTTDWEYEVVSIGFPGTVNDGKPAFEPRNLGHGWVGYDFAAHFDKPVKIINDAAMQALGSYEGGRMLFLGLGTGLGSTLIAGKLVLPLDLGQVPYRASVVDDFVSRRALERMGRKKWETVVADVCHILRHCVMADYVMLGGGNSRKISQLPPGVRRGANQRAFLGGYRLWNMSATLTPTTHPAEADPSPPRSDWRIA